MRANAVILFVPKYGIEGPVYFAEKPKTTPQKAKPGAAPEPAAESEFTLDASRQRVVSRDGSREYAVFDKAAVRISVEETHGNRRQLKLEIVDRSELPLSEQTV